MTEVKRLQDMTTLDTLLSHLDKKVKITDWKMSLQKTVDNIVSRFVSLPSHRQTGLQMLQIVGEEWKGQTRSLSVPKHILEQLSAKIIQQLLKNIVHDYNHIENLGYQEISGIKGHVVIDKEGRRQIHVFLVDESLPKVCKVYEWYLAVHTHKSEVATDDVIVHFLLEEKKITFSAPEATPHSTDHQL